MEEMEVCLADNLRGIRLRAGETQWELAEVCGVSPTAISNYEHGNRQPDLETLVRIARHYHVTLDELVFKS